MIKQRRESLAQYQNAGRADLADQEAFEIELIQAYLPAPLSAFTNRNRVHFIL
jgi:hypothetical protein